MSQIRILLVDDHAVVREGYRRLLEREADLQIVGEAGTAAQACALVISAEPHVVVMDIALPGCSGIEAMQRMLTDRPSLRVLMFSMHDDAIFCSRALRAGALGYVSKSSAPEVLVRAVYSVARGERYVSADVASKVARPARPSAGPSLAALSPRELEVFRLLAQGETVRNIGEQLGLSEKTVANHQSVIRDKLGVKNGAQLARLAAQLGLAR